MGGAIFHFQGDRVSSAQVVYDLTFWFFCTILIITQKGVILQKNFSSKKNPKTLLQEYYFFRFIDLKNVLSNMPSKILVCTTWAGEDRLKPIAISENSEALTSIYCTQTYKYMYTAGERQIDRSSEKLVKKSYRQLLNH